MDKCRGLLYVHGGGSVIPYSRRVPNVAYESHHPAQHKRSVFNTLIHCANTIPSNHTLKMDEMKRVQESLQINGYPAKFIERAAAPRSNPRSDEPERTGLAVVPYVKGVSD